MREARSGRRMGFRKRNPFYTRRVMVYLILSDIHGNREALEAVLADARGRYDRIVCLGDLVGYGADPNFVVEWVQSNVAAIVRGNHDRIAVEDDALDAYRDVARDSTLWTRKALAEGNRDYLLRMPRGPLPFEGFDLVHGSPLDEDEYLIGVSDAAPLLPHLQTALTFFGHTHVQGGFLIIRRGVKQIDPLRTLRSSPAMVTTL